LNYSGAEHYRHSCQWMEKASLCLCLHNGPTFQWSNQFYCRHLKTGTVDEVLKCQKCEQNFLSSGISPPESDSLWSGHKFYPWCFIYFFFQCEISEMRRPTGVKFCTMVSTRPNFIMPVQNFGGHTPKKFQGPKTCKIWPDFGWLQSLAANISEMDEDIQNRIVIPSIAIPPALGKTSPVKFGPVTLEI